MRACERDCESVFVDDGLSECLRECFYESGSSFTLLLSADVLSKGSCRFLGHTHVHSQSGTLSRKHANKLNDYHSHYHILKMSHSVGPHQITQ